MSDELIGYDEIIGDDDLDDLLDELSGDGDVEIGARGGRGRSLSARMARARNIDPNAVALVKRKRGPRRRKVLPGKTSTVAAGAEVVVNLTSEEDFRPERLVCSGADVDKFDIVSVKVGTEEQFVASGDCPAAAFAPNAKDTDIHFKTLNVGSKLTVTFKNVDAASGDIRFAFVGTAVD
jgi:hypothetical protein